MLLRRREREPTVGASRTPAALTAGDVCLPGCRPRADADPAESVRRRHWPRSAGRALWVWRTAVRAGAVARLPETERSAAAVSFCWEPWPGGMMVASTWRYSCSTHASSAAVATGEASTHISLDAVVLSSVRVMSDHHYCRSMFAAPPPPGQVGSLQELVGQECTVSRLRLWRPPPRSDGIAATGSGRAALPDSPSALLLTADEDRW